MPAVKSPPEPPADAIAPAADPQPAAEVAAAEPPPEPLPDTIVPADEPETEAEAVVFDKPSPFASAPVLQVEDPAPATEAPPQSSPAPAAPLGSAPIPSMKPAESTAEAPPAPAAPLESAPTPSMEPAASTAEAPPANDVAPPKPRVDINLDSAGDGAKENEVEAEEDEFLDTVIIPPNALASSNDSGGNSTNAFIARVKEQLTTSESVAANGKDSFSSTIPQ